MNIEATAVIHTTGITSLSLVSTEVDAGISQLSKGGETKKDDQKRKFSLLVHPLEGILMKFFQLISFNRG